MDFNERTLNIPRDVQQAMHEEGIDRVPSLDDVVIARDALPYLRMVFQVVPRDEEPVLDHGALSQVEDNLHQLPLYIYIYIYM